MLDRILTLSIRHRVAVVLAVLVLALLGADAARRLPIDAVPDITNRQVQINTLDPSLSPVEMERLVTFPIEAALAGIPGLEQTRSFSRNGFSQVTAVFRDHVDVYFARQQVAERLAAVRDTLPPAAEPRLGPITTGLGEIFMWTVEFVHPNGEGAEPHDGQAGWQSDGTYRTVEGETLASELERAAYLRTVQDWIIRPQLVGIDGLAAVDTIGGYVKQYHVQPRPRDLAAYGLTFHDLTVALERNNLATGAGWIEHNGEAYVVRASGRLEDVRDLGDVVVAERQGTPLRVRDVASVGVGPELRTGSATENGEEVVIGTALMLVGANSRTVSQAVGERLARVNETLPPDVRARTVLDRTTLVDATIRTVMRNLIEGACLVVVLLFVLLGNFRAALVTALAIPLSMLLTAIGMVQTRTSGNLMSLGAIDFGLIVDGAVIVVENCLRMLGERRRKVGRPLTLSERLTVVREASTQVRSATAFGEAIIVIVYIPILFLTGVEGKMFRPMALTVIFALCAAFVLSLTFVPAMVALFVRDQPAQGEGRLIAAAQRVYAPLLRASLRSRTAVVAMAAVGCVGSLLVFGRLGQEFVPTLSELDVVVHAIRIPSTSLDQATAMQRRLERALGTVPEIGNVFSRTGTADVGSDPMPPYVSDTFIMLAPRETWPRPADTKEDVRRRIEEVLEGLPGNAYEFTQPIQMRFNELLAGVRSDVAVKVFGDDFERMVPAAEAVAAVLRDVPGAADVRVEEITGAPVLSVDVDRKAAARYGLTVADVHEVLAIAVGGHPAGELFEGDRRFDIVVRLAEDVRRDPRRLERLPIPLSHEDEPLLKVELRGDDVGRAPLRSVPLAAVATIAFGEGPNQVSRENGKRRVVVQANVRGRDLGSFVEEARTRVESEVSLTAGTWLAWGGQFENLVAAKRRLGIVVPICLLAILGLLFTTFGTLRNAVLVFTGVPLALCGGILALWLRGMPFSISAAVGFIALSGIAVLNGLVLLTFIEQLRAEGQAPLDAVVRGAMTRLRPVLVTALVASFGFVPMAIATGTGAEVQRPLATVVIGGIVSSTLLTLIVLPALYALFPGRPRPT